MFRRWREALGCGLVSLDQGARPLIRELSEGRSVGLVVDARDDDGAPIPFFGLDKWTTLAPARLALRFGCDLIPVRVERRGNARFRLTVYKPVRKLRWFLGEIGWPDVPRSRGALGQAVGGAGGVKGRRKRGKRSHAQPGGGRAWRGPTL